MWFDVCFVGFWFYVFWCGFGCIRGGLGVSVYNIVVQYDKPLYHE